MKLFVAVALLAVSAVAQNVEYTWAFAGDACTADTMIGIAVDGDSSDCTAFGCTCAIGLCAAVSCGTAYDRNLLGTYGNVYVVEQYSAVGCVAADLSAASGSAAGVCTDSSSTSSYYSCNSTTVIALSYSDTGCVTLSGTAEATNGVCSDGSSSSASNFCTSGASVASVTSLAFATVVGLAAYLL
eukprot:NODE_1806_length_733_cov_70.156766_g1756_i0.p1 GENE.NODE_1806_length_733_cov_70.156766_g1756_i0~~NODE_1806_length_733_cov_70.156766_g1756_i0.p1  ORF type:complete len:185 (-),score=49.68 NODE_1806_length_733_cov_70.156766_g1756_i0:104-658(-)